MVINKSQTAEVVPRNISIHSFCLFFSKENHGDGSGVDLGEFFKSFWILPLPAMFGIV